MRVPALAALAAVLLILAIGLQWLGFASGRAAGEISLLATPIALTMISWFIGAHLSAKRRVLAAAIAAATAVLFGLINYYYLWWLRVEHFREIDVGLFQYFGAIYGAGMQLTVIACALVAIAGAHISRR